ncbi:MAG: PEP-CTERM sorting domain-containing protein [Planctomycetota bacterium]
MKRCIFTIIAIACFTILCPRGYAGILLNFDDQERNTTQLNNIGIVYRAAGFQIENAQIFGTPQPVFLVAGQQSENYAGSASLFSNTFNGTSLFKINGDLFTLNSMDIAKWLPANPNGDTIEFLGTKGDGSQVRQQFTFSGNTGFETVSFSDFTDLKSVFWKQTSPGHQFDNVLLNSTSAVVPEPSMFALGSIGALGVVGLRRRKVVRRTN